jgi:23S rRNA pseudouridine2457 synthase
MTTLVFNKPFDVITRFTAPANAKEDQVTLAPFIADDSVWPIGRLDRDSEGLLLLSTDRLFRTRLLDPAFNHQRSYLAQVEGTVTPEALRSLEAGVVIEGKRTRPAIARLIDERDDLWDRVPPIRHRVSVPTAWIELTLTEGRNRQVRKMTASVGLPCLRLIRRSILHLDVFDLGLQPGESRELSLTETRDLAMRLRAD